MALTPRTIAKTAVEQYGALQKPAELAGLLALLLDLQPKPRVLVEIGCDRGGTLWAWQQIGIPRLIGVEYPSTKEHPNPWGTGRPLDAHGAEIIVGDSHEETTYDKLVAALAGDPIDVLFIDGDHTYDGVKQDFLMYAPLVANEGRIVFHDVCPHPRHPDVGVQKFWQKIGGDKEEIITAPGDWGGIGVVRQWVERPIGKVVRNG